MPNLTGNPRGREPETWLEQVIAGRRVRFARIGRDMNETVAAPRPEETAMACPHVEPVVERDVPLKK